MDTRYIKWQDQAVNRQAFEQRNQHRSVALWFTGLSGAGKSTVANAVAMALFDRNYQTYVLDGDNVRHGLCKDLGFSAEDRTENLRRVGEVAKLFVDAGSIVLSAFISPFALDRASVRALFDADDFVEIYCSANLAVCETRDVKGLYAKARAGVIKEFTGISSPYEPPLHPELLLDTGNSTVSQCVDQVLVYLKSRLVIEQ